MKKLCLLVPDLTENCFGRAYVLAQLLAQDFDIEIVGPKCKGGVWLPLRYQKEFRVRQLTTKLNIRAILNELDCDILYAVKPRVTSYGYAIIKKLFSKQVVLLDIDDWELGFKLDSPIWKIAMSAFAFWNFESVLYRYLLEKLTFIADGITVSSSFLQLRFGGEIIVHARDGGIFNPKKYSKTLAKRKLSLSKRRVILFLGTIRSHKGVDYLLKSVDLLPSDDYCLLLVGVVPGDIKIEPEKLSRVKLLGRQPFHKIPSILAAADVVVIPQVQSKSSQGQLPAKLFDAMAMKKPIITSNWSNVRAVTKNAVIVVNIEDAETLSSAIRDICENAAHAKQLANRARRIFEKYYSLDAVRPKLQQTVQRALSAYSSKRR